MGFISLLTSQVYPIKYFGLFTAFGVMMAMVFSLILIPAGILAFGLPHPKKKMIDEDDDAEHDHFAYKFAHLAIRHKTFIYIATIIIVAISIFGVTKVWINSKLSWKNLRQNATLSLRDQVLSNGTFLGRVLSNF